MDFPAEQIPDGAIFAPHHYIYGTLLALITVFIVWDNYRAREPLLAALGASTGLFGFLFVWQFYPVAGALMSLVGPLITIVAVSLGWTGTSVGDVWDDYPLRYRVAAIFFSLVALDDAVEHAFDIPTPLDIIWGRFLVERVPLTALILISLLVGAILLRSVYADPERPKK